MIISVFEGEENNVENKENAGSPFPTEFLKACILKDLNTMDCNLFGKELTLRVMHDSVVKWRICNPESLDLSLTGSIKFHIGVFLGKVLQSHSLVKYSSGEIFLRHE